MKIVLAGNYEEFRQWCRENDLDHREQVCVTGQPDDTRHLLGLRYSMSDVVWVGTWSEGRNGETTDVVRMLALTDPEAS